MVEQDNPERVAAPGDAPSDHARDAAERRELHAAAFADDPGPVPAPVRPLKNYLGDAVYADFDGFAFVLTTEGGYRATNRIVLEPDVFRRLVDYVEQMRRRVGMPR